MVLTQSCSSILGGQYMSHFNRYGELIWVGFGAYTLGSGLLILANRTIHLGLVSLFLVFTGFGIGLTFQPTLVALQAHCPKAQRAVVTSNRNFLRSSGGAVGLAVSSAILSNVLKASLPTRLQSIAESTFAAPDLSKYSELDRSAIADAYADASRAVFIFCLPVAGIAFLLSALITDKGLIRKEEQVATVPSAAEKAVTEAEQDPKETTSTSDQPSEHDHDQSEDQSPSLSSNKSEIQNR